VRTLITFPFAMHNRRRRGADNWSPTRGGCIRAFTPRLRAARELAEKIKQRKIGADGFLSCRDVYLKGWSGLDSPEVVRLAAEVLVDAAWLRELPGESGHKAETDLAEAEAPEARKANNKEDLSWYARVSNRLPCFPWPLTGLDVPGAIPPCGLTLPWSRRNRRFLVRFHPAWGRTPSAARFRYLYQLHRRASTVILAVVFDCSDRSRFHPFLASFHLF